MAEVINVAQENADANKLEKQAGIIDEQISSDSDSSDDDVPDGSANDKQGPIDKFKDYKKREQGLHRQHRGVMQWKVCSSHLIGCELQLTFGKTPRTAKWVKHKVDGVGDKVSSIFDRHTGQAGVETEV